MKRFLAIAVPSMSLIVLLLIFIAAKRPESKHQTIANLVDLAPLPAPQSIDIHFTDRYQKKLEQAITDYFKNAVDKNQIVGASVAIVKCDSIIYSGGFGSKNVALKDTVDAETVFRIGSVSKGFAGVLAGIHVQDSLIGWSDKIIDHIPNFKLANAKLTQQITLSHVLSHTSGLPYHSFTNLVEDGLSLTTIAGRFNEVLPLEKPGNVYNYQNAIFALSGEIIERVTHQPLKEVIKNRIFEPLAMKTASASYEELTLSDNVAMPHQRIRRGWRPTKINKKYYNAVAAGGINASATDMGKWMKFLLGNHPDVLMASTMKEVFNPKVQVGGRRNYYQRWPGYKASFYGLGWRVHEFYDNKAKQTNKVIHHGGGVNNYRSEIAIYPDEDLGICVLFNSPNKMAKDCIPKLHKIIQEIIVSPQFDEIKESFVVL
ncbi:beta-lactamase family protein [Aquimarina sp. U1-2]|uniref:serine hydrolase domain-containing protein n=1 Tax=Aquimarina sp. U1-2 TaxID=2823141 RepID=UPI001AED02D2|nr:serine hydrolase domain-containing protein [Aquimarina sp. U1-2]MBP2832589.1 beta-lactamase family protein [Aquimarina sp. U1-2]